MVKKRIIPTLLLAGERLVKGVKFKNLRDVGYPVTAVSVYDAQVCDELIFLDIRSGRNGRKRTLEILARSSETCFAPLSAGGGVSTIDDIHEFLCHGADKVVINTAAVLNPGLISDSAKKFGKQCVVVSIDYIEKPSGEREVVIEGGGRPVGIDPYEQALKMADLGAGELVMTSVSRDGMRCGCDLDLIAKIKRKVSIPVIVRGGIGTLEDFVKVFSETDADAVAAGSIFHFTDQSPIKVRTWLNRAGVNIRIPAKEKLAFF